MCNSKIISIIVPVYNVEQYLITCVESLRNQTYSNLEIILIDDGSQDKSSQLCDELEKKDKRIKTFHRINKGPSAARNYGLSIATGDYILFVDSDDYIEADMCKQLIDNMTNVDVVICGVKKEGIENGVFPLNSFEDIIDSKEMTEWLLLGKKVKSWPVNKLIKRSLIGELRFNESIKYEEDVDFYLRLFSTRDAKIRFIPYVGYHYVVRRNSLTNTYSNRLSSYESINNGVLDTLPHSDGLVYRRLTLFMNECRIYALCGMKNRNEDKKIISRNVSYIRTNLKLVEKYLNSGQLKRCRLLTKGYYFFCIAEQLNAFRRKIKNGRNSNFS